MNLKFIDRAITTTCQMATVCLIPTVLIWGVWDGLAVFAGAAWGCANVLFIKHLVQSLMGSEPKNYLKIGAVLALKFPMLYLIGYFLLTAAQLSAMGLLVGSSMILGVIFFKSLTRLKGSTAVWAALAGIGALSTSTSLQATLNAEVPEVPNLFTLLNKIFDHAPWTTFLHHWENIIFSVIIAAAISLVFSLGARKRQMIPSGFQNFLEWSVETLRSFILDILGPRGDKFVPFLGTIFIYVLCMNWAATIPFMKAPSSSFSVTCGLALTVFVLVQYLNIRNWGVVGFLYHMAGSPKGALGWALVPLMFPIELLTQFTRPLTLALRLFGNVVGEDILIGAGAVFGVFVVSLLSESFLGGLPTQIPFMFMAILTGLMQALVFTLLSVIYILLSMPSEEEEAAHWV